MFSFKILSLRTRLSIVIVLLAVLISGGGAHFLYEVRKAEFLDGVDDKLKAGATMARAIVGADYHDGISDQDSVTDEVYRQVVVTFNALCAENGYQYLWSNLFLEDGRVVFTSGASAGHEMAQGDFAPFFTAHEDPVAFDSVKKAGIATYTTFENERGIGRMILVPFKDANGRTYVFGASVSLDHLNAHFEQAAAHAIEIFIILICVMSIVGIWLSRAYSRPILSLVNEAKKIANGNYNIELLTPSSAPEVVQLSGAIKDIGLAVDRSQKQLRQTNETLTERVLERTALLSQTQALAHLGSWSLNHIRDELVWSDEVFHIFGRDSTSFEPCFDAFLEHVHPDDREYVAVQYQNAVDGKHPYDIEHRIVRQDTKEVRWVHQLASHMRDAQGKIIRSDGSVQDITSRKLAELERSESQARYRQLVDNTNEGYWFIDPNGRTIDVNGALCQMLGRSREEILGKTIYEFVDEENRGIFKRQLELRKQGKKDSYELALQRPDGTSVSCLNTPTSIFDDDDQLVGSIGLWTDITKIKEANAQLVEAKRMAERANDSKSAFLANMSHEIRTPMNGVIGMAEILARSDLSTDQRRQLQTIRNSSHSLLRILDDILDMSKIEAGKLDLEIVETNLGDLLESIAITMAPVADERGVRLQLIIAPETPEVVQFDPVRLRQIVNNLMSNAIKFSSNREDGRNGIVYLRSTFHSDQSRLEISVSDNGIGMSPVTVENLFQPFSQAEASTTRRFGGSGLGLSITKNLIDLMGGDINVTSELGKGSTLTCSLPCDSIKVSTASELSGKMEALAYFDAEADLDVARSNQNLQNNWQMTVFGSEEELQDAIVRTKGSVIILLALGTMEENNRLRRKIPDPENRLRFLCQTYERSDEMGLIDPNCFVASRFPTLPSELLAGYRALVEGQQSSTAMQDEGSVVGTSLVSSLVGKRVLVVEDNETNREVIATQLGILGLDVELAKDGNEGLEKWCERSYDLILSDCHMPNLDGFQMTAAIRSREREIGFDRIPIVAITANALSGEAEKCFAAGMDDYLSKPVSLEKLRMSVVKLFGTGVLYP